MQLTFDSERPRLTRPFNTFARSTENNSFERRAPRFLAVLGFALLLNSASALEDAPLPKRFGKVISVSGKATATKPDGRTAEIHVGDELPAGTVVKTGKEATVNLFFRRIGTIVQVQTNSVLALDKLEMEMRDGKLVKRTELSLKEGKFLSCIRVLIPESKVIVRTPKATFHVPGTGLGRFQFSADGSAIVGRRSKLTLIADVGGEPIAVMPGYYFDGKSTNAVQPNPAFFEQFSKAMDILQKTASELTPPPAPEELPGK
jgi:hypothetical protein